MVPILLVAALAVAQGPQKRDYPSGTERRVFDVRSRDAWPVVQARLKDLGLTMDKVDKKNQALVTKAQGTSAWNWFPGQQQPARYVVDRIRFIVFVSPFVEPAHISVGSQAWATTTTQGALALVFNMKTANQALMAEVENAIAAAALPKFARDGPDPCSNPQGPLTSNPVRIPLSVLEWQSGEGGKSGTIAFDLNVAQDGGVTQFSAFDLPADGELQAAARGAASLLLYSPLRRGGCPASFIMTYQVNFGPVRR